MTEYIKYPCINTSATIILNISLCMFARYASLRKRALSKINIAYDLFLLFDHFLALC